MDENGGGRNTGGVSIDAPLLTEAHNKTFPPLANQPDYIYIRFKQKKSLIVMDGLNRASSGASKRCILDLLLILFEMTPFFFSPPTSLSCHERLNVPEGA